MTHRAKVTVEPSSKGSSKVIIEMRPTAEPHFATNFQGLLKGTAIKLFATSIEHDVVYTGHLIGMLGPDNEANGKLMVMLDGTIAARGQWTLTKAKEPATNRRASNSTGSDENPAPRMVHYSEIPDRLQIIGKLGQPLGRLVTVRGRWTAPFPSSPASPVFMVNQVNGRLLAAPVEFVDVEPVWEKDAELAKKTVGEEWELRGVETGGFVGVQR